MSDKELLIVGGVGVLALVYLMSRNAAPAASVVVQNQMPLQNAPTQPTLQQPSFSIAQCCVIHPMIPTASPQLCNGIVKGPVVTPVSDVPLFQPTLGNPLPNVYDSVQCGVDLTQANRGLTDTVPAIGSQPANIPAWNAAYSSPGVWQWSLMSNPSVSYMADASGKRVS